MVVPAAAVVRVLVIDDDYYVREAMRSLLAKDRRTHVWGVTDSVSEAVRLMEATPGPRPDLVLLDVRLGDEAQGGIEGISTIRESCPQTKILMTSVANDEETVLSAIRAGADGYVWKNESTDGIANAIVRVTEGRFVVTQSVAERLLGKTAELSTTMTEILHERPGLYNLTEAMRKTVYLYCFCGMSAREIADELTLSVNTVNSRIKLAYQILSATSRQEAFQRLVEGPER